jgi:hypothetical protein
MRATKTVNPLPFEHLEHHRFEDLVRQLTYDFRPWRKLEATGRAGSESGFDARGWEIVGPIEQSMEETAKSDELRDGTMESVGADRLWLIQCKREKSIGPTRALAYLAEIPEEELRTLYGLVFVAPTNFSRKTRDQLAAKCGTFGIQEVHVWGRGELEDMLFQPKNDHLLFAYFGISLQIRRRSERSELRARLAMKRKAHRLLDDKVFRHLLIREPSADEYPSPPPEGTPSVERKWAVRRFEGFDWHGLLFRHREYFAFVHDDGKQWDAAFAFNLATNSTHDDRWFGVDDVWANRRPFEEAWQSLPEKNRATYRIVGIIAYEDVLDIDELGDDLFEEPHVYAKAGLWSTYHSIEQSNRRTVLYPIDSDRIAVFPAEMRTDSDSA